MSTPAAMQKRRVDRDKKTTASDHAAGFLEGVKSLVWDRQIVRSIESPSENCEEQSVTAAIEVKTNCQNRTAHMQQHPYLKFCEHCRAVTAHTSFKFEPYPAAAS